MTFVTNQICNATPKPLGHYLVRIASPLKMLGMQWWWLYHNYPPHDFSLNVFWYITKQYFAKKSE